MWFAATMPLPTQGLGLVLKKILRYGLPLIIVVAGVFIARGMMQSRPQAVQVATLPPAVLVEVATAYREHVMFSVSSQGSIRPRTATTLVSEVSGQIVQVSPEFVSGGFFNRGDILVRIDPSNYRTAVKKAKASVKKAETQVATENALAGYAVDDWQRLRSLNAATKEASDLTLRKPQLAEVLAELDSAAADFEKATRDLNRTIIRAPYDGMVREKLADIGQFINTGTDLAAIFATDSAEVRLPLTQQDLRFVNLPDRTNRAHLPTILKAVVGGEEQSWSAKIVRSEGVFDEDQRVLYVVAQIDEPYVRVAPGEEPARIGTFVTAEIEGKDAGNLFVIPRHSLSRGDTLWVVDADQMIQPRSLDIVRSDQQFAYVDGGLEEGTRYCVTPPSQPLPGMRVRVDGDG